MPDSLIFTEGKTVFIQLDRIIDNGLILIFNHANELVLQKEFRNSNFEKIKIADSKGQFTIKLVFERITISKRISIN